MNFDVKELRSVFNRGVWWIEYCGLRESLLEIRGWAIPPLRHRGPVTFTADHHPFDTIEYPLLREDVGRVFYFHPSAKDSGFICRLKLADTNWNYLRFQFADEKTGAPFSAFHDEYFLKSSLDMKAPIPDAERIKRVQGNESTNLFVQSGFTTYMKLQDALKSRFGKAFADFSNVLDWGCGPGRLFRYFGILEKASVTGVDVDSDNIGWCKRNLPFGTFHTIPVHPPTQFRAASFDLIFGISIFTHLGENLQFQWLSELKRIATKNAIVLMTTKGKNAICRDSVALAKAGTWYTHGFLDIRADPALHGIPNIPIDYYRAVFHTEDYIRREWSKYFDVVDIIPGYIGSYQDLVVMHN